MSSRDTLPEQTSVSASGSLPLEERIDLACAALEDQWIAGTRPRIGDYLSRFTDRERMDAFSALLEVDLWHRRRRGESPTAREYGQEFSEFQTTIDAAVGIGNSISAKRHRSECSTHTPTDESTRQPGTPPPVIENALFRIGKYDVLSEVARGGMGVVYKARQRGVDRIVALKMTLAGGLATPDARRRFLIEAQSAGQLQHPNIVPIHEVGEQDGQPYFTMGFIEGECLKTRLAAGPMAASEAARLAKTISHAVAYAHVRGVIHRDLKPANVLLDGDGNPHVTDFGLAKRVSTDSSLTSTGDILGTPTFMPPEQAKGRLDEIGPRSDIYSLGAVLYCMLTGRPPFQAPTVIDTLMQVAEQEPVAPRALVASIPVDLETVCLKCLHKDPAGRYASAQELADDLGRFLRNEPVHARPIGRLERGWRWCRRNPLLAGLITGTLSLLAAIGMVMTVAYVRESRLVIEKDKLATREKERRLEAERLTAEKAALAVEKTALARLAQAKREEAEEKSAELQLELAQQAFTRGLVEYDGNHFDEADRQFLRAVQLLPEGHPLRPCWMEVWFDRVTRGGRSCLPPMRHQGTIYVNTFSTDGSKILTVSTDGTAQLWNSITGAPLGAPLPHPGHPYKGEFSPDGEKVAIGCLDGTVTLWDVRRREKLGPPLDQRAAVHGVTFSPEGSRLVTLGNDGIGRLWDTSTGALLAGLRSRTGRVTALAVDPHRLRLVAGNSNSAAQVYCLASGALVGKPLHHPEAVTSVAFIPGDGGVATTCQDGSFRIWSIKDGSYRELALGGQSKLRDAAISPDGAQAILITVASALTVDTRRTSESIKRQSVRQGNFQNAIFSSDGLFVGMTGGGTAIVEKPQSPGSGDVVRVGPVSNALEFSPDGTRFVVGGGGCTRIWQMREAPLVQLRRPGRREFTEVRVAKFSPDGTRVFTAFAGRNGQLFDTRTGHMIGEPMAFATEVKFAEFSPDGASLLTRGEAWVGLWDAMTGAPIGRPLVHGKPLSTASFSRDGIRVVTGSIDKTARIWDALTGTPLGKPMQHGEVVSGAAFTPDGRRLLTGSRVGQFWDVNSCELLGGTLPGRVDNVVFNRLGDRFVTIGGDTARLWDAVTCQPLGSEMHHTGKIECAVFSYDGSRLASAGLNGTVRILDARTGEPVGAGFSTLGAVNGISLDATGSRLLTYGAGARLWDATTGAALGEFLARPSPVLMAEFSPDGERLVTAEMGQARIWDIRPVVRGEELRISDFEILTGLDCSGGRDRRSLSNDEWHARWRLFEADPPPWYLRILARQEEQRLLHLIERTGDAEDEENWFGAAAALDRLIALRPDDLSLRERRSYASAKLSPESRNLLDPPALAEIPPRVPAK